MGMLSDWANKIGTATPGGINPSAPPQQFLGQILNNVIGDKKATDNDSIRESTSPIDLVAAEAGAGLGGIASKAAPRLLGNEIGSVGSDVEQSMADRIRAAAQKSNVKSIDTTPQETLRSVKMVPTTDQLGSEGLADQLQQAKFQRIKNLLQGN